LKKKALIIFTTVTWLMILCPFAILGYINYQKHSLKNDVYAYLLEKYQEDDILEIDTTLTKASYHFTTFVTFRDEPDQKYEYIRVDKEIRQASPNPNEEEEHLYKHLDFNK